MNKIPKPCEIKQKERVMDVAPGWLSQLQKELTEAIHVACIEGGVVFLDTMLSSNYSFKPPKVTFHTRIYHNNINSQGFVCLNILKVNWNPTSTVSKILWLTRSLWQTASLQILQLEALLLSIDQQSRT
ncbi:unnamed protein product [Nyctereutes procyonoides]|uniref:(raccoon dog) hypothetical protein n=1 Tax=Nyctereutes procyonoides TaxID=34880 RepID=A0A811ZS31_NYCPR|nr:unnamed protein product [Nyctereutes procyonoides]